MAKEPGIATIISLIVPGWGLIYAEEFKRGISIFIGMVILGACCLGLWSAMTAANVELNMIEVQREVGLGGWDWDREAQINENLEVLAPTWLVLTIVALVAYVAQAYHTYRRVSARRAETHVATADRPQFNCGNCGKTITYGDAYCRGCAAPIDWSGIAVAPIPVSPVAMPAPPKKRQIPQWAAKITPTQVAVATAVFMPLGYIAALGVKGGLKRFGLVIGLSILVNFVMAILLEGVPDEGVGSLVMVLLSLAFYFFAIYDSYDLAKETRMQTNVTTRPPASLFSPL